MNVQQKYFSKKTKGETVAAIISDIVTGCISKNDLTTVVSLLEDKGFFENTNTFNKLDSSNWDEKYLNKLRFKIDCLSPEYFNYLYEVSKTVRERKKIHERAVLQFKLIIIGVCAILLLFLMIGIRSCSKKSKVNGNVETEVTDNIILQNEGENDVSNSI